MFLYILDAKDIPDKDIGSRSDPYIVVNIGNKEISVNNYIYSLKINIYRTTVNLDSTSK